MPINRRILSSTVARLAGAGLLALAAAGCDQGLTELNNNPNSPTSIQPNLLFPNAETDATGRVGFDINLTGLWAQHFSNTRFTEPTRYAITAAQMNSAWSGFYSSGLEDLQTIINTTTPETRPNLLGPALVMKSFLFGVMTDLWGDIPYSKALTGDPATPPTYDTQKSIYDGIFADLTAANNMLGGAGPTYGSSDLFYGGDPVKWRRFANSLRLRHALRLTKVDAATAKTQALAAIAAGVFISNADMPLLKYPGDGTNDSPLYNTFRTREDQHLSSALVDTLKHLYVSISATNDTTFDPRLAVYALPIAAVTNKAVYVGQPSGVSESDATLFGLTKTSKPGTFYTARTTPAILMSYADVLLDQAEVAARGWNTADPALLYAAGIRASMQYNNIPETAIAAYIASPRVAYNPATGLAQIQLQKWIALYGQGVEAWIEYRRTNVPNLVAGPAVVTTPQIVPRRFVYPTSEQSFNNDNLQAALTAQGGAGQNLVDRVWWDVP